MVGIVLFQIFNILCSTGLLDFEVYELVYCVLQGVICVSGCAKI